MDLDPISRWLRQTKQRPSWLARESGVSPQKICDFRAGRLRNLSPSDAFAIEEALGGGIPARKLMTYRKRRTASARPAPRRKASARPAPRRKASRR